VAQVRAGLIALAIGLGLVDGCPLPPPQYVRPWQAPIVDVVRPIQHAILAPFRWITKHVRFSQRWALFQVAERDAHRLEIDGRVHGGPWLAAVSRRRSSPRGLRRPPRARAGARCVGSDRSADVPVSRARRWLTQRILDDHPELQAVRLRFEKIVIDEGTVRGTGIYVYPFGRERGQR